MSVPLYQAEAEFFRMPGHPVRIRVLAVLRRSGIVASQRDGEVAAR